MRLRLFLYAALTALPAVCGCLSVSIVTEADRRGGGTRTYTVTLDPSLAKTYESVHEHGKLFTLPGDELAGRAGVALTAQSRTTDTSGVMVTMKKYQCRRLTDAGTATDSIRYAVERRGVWVYYRYAEQYLANDIDSTKVMQTYGEQYRFRHALRLPGTVVRTDADSVIRGDLVWSRPMRQVRTTGAVMTAESRELNPLVWAVLALAALIAAVAAIVFRSKRAQS